MKLVTFLVSMLVVVSWAGMALGALPQGWDSCDIGAPVPGSASESGGVFTVTGDGHDIWDSSDDFHYAYLPLRGDGEIVARVVSITGGTNEWRQAGVMIRETLTGPSKHVFMAMTNPDRTEHAAAFKWRSDTGGRGNIVAVTPAGYAGLPWWVKLVRQGNVFSSYQSPDGFTWTQQGSSTTVDMALDACIGLAVTAHDTAELATATFDNLTVLRPPQGMAMNPDPADGSARAPLISGTNVYMVLDYTPGSAAISHTGYFSDVRADVESRDPAHRLGSPPWPESSATAYYVGYDDPAIPAFARTPLVPGKTYYWCVDEFDGTKTWSGNVWSFAVMPEETCWGPTPADGDTLVIMDPNVLLSWHLGNVLNPTDYTIKYPLYYSTSKTAVDTGTIPNVTVSTTSKSVAGLAYNTTIYWRVDTKLYSKVPPFQAVKIIKGKTWSFTTASNGVGTILLIAPNGAEVLAPGSTYPIAWSSTGSISNVLIEYSTDNGQNWNNITTAPNTGAYDWLVPAVSSNQCLIRISDASDPSINDVSDSVFTVGVGVAVPDVVGMPQDEAESVITSAGLAVGTVTHDYSDTVAAGLVVSQTPVGGTAVPIGSAVSIVVSLGKGFSGLGSGTSGDPYIITNVNELQEMNNEPSAWYELGNDIDASDTINWNSGEGFIPISPFSGTFDGQKYNITDLFINRSGSLYQGLFGYTENSEIKNVGLINVFVSGKGKVGGLVGFNGGTIDNSSATGNVIGSQNALVGIDIGGLVGRNNLGTIENSYSIGNVEGRRLIGGLIGNNNNGTILNSYSAANVTGTQYFVGGLVGQNWDGNIINSYAIGKVIGSDYVGGLTAKNTGTCTNSYWDTETSNQGTSACGEGKTTSEMMQKPTFVNWDFVNVWDIQEGLTYPFLRFLTRHVIVPDVVDLPQSEAESTIVAAGLAVGTVTHDYSDTVAAGFVISQSPVGGTAVTTGSAVSIVVSLGQLVVPNTYLILTLNGYDVTDSPLIQSMGEFIVAVEGSTEIEPNDVSVGAVGGVLEPVGDANNEYYFEFDADSNEATISLVTTVAMVIDGNSIPAGTTIYIPAGTTIYELYIFCNREQDIFAAVGIGLADLISFEMAPDVVGMTQSAAVSAITSSGLTVGTVTHDYSDTIPAGSVISQSPVGGTAAPVGSAVSIVVSLGQSVVPNVVEMTLSEAMAAIASEGLTIGSISYRYDAVRPRREVIAQEPATGIVVPVGSGVKLTVSLGSNAITFYVDNDSLLDPEPNNPDISDPNENGSGEHPYDSVQEAVDVALPGDTVILLTGVYTGKGNRDIDYEGKAISVRSTDPNDPNVVVLTVIDCEDAGRGFYFHSGEDSNSVLEGLTILNGLVTGKVPPGGGGAGINCHHSAPTLRKVSILDSHADFGGGISCTGASPCISDTIISSDSANLGGGVYFGENSSPILENVVIRANSSDLGGGIYSEGSSEPNFDNVIISGNSAAYGGALSGSDSSHMRLNNVTVSGNRADLGGAIFLEGEARLTLSNAILWNDTPQEIYLTGEHGPVSITISYCDIEDSVEAIVSDTNSTVNWLEGNIDADPYFADTGYWDTNDTPEDVNDDVWIDGDYHLQSRGGRWDPNSRTWVIDANTSPCIDTGDPNFPVGYEPAPNRDIINLGVYGGTEQASKSYRPILSTFSTGGGSLQAPGEGSYEYFYKTVVPIVALADLNHHFVRWSGTAVEAGSVHDANAAETTVLMDADYSLIAEFAIDQRTLNISSNLGGSVIRPGEGSFAYDHDTEVELLALTDLNYHFVRWIGTAVDAGRVGNPSAVETTVLMDADYTLTAEFEIDQRALAVSSTIGGSVLAPGEGQFDYDHGSIVSITVQADLNHHFVNWTGSAVEAGKVADVNAASTTVLMDADYNLNAQFAIDQRFLTVSSTSGGSVTAPGEGRFQYDHGTVVLIQAAADTNHHFVRWTGTAVDAGNVHDPNEVTSDVLMDADYTLTAEFAINRQILETSSSFGGSVSTPGEGSFIYDNGTEVSVIAWADPNYHFVRWTGTAVDAGKVKNPNTAVTTVVMDADYTLHAHFAIDQRILTISSSGGGSVTTPGEGLIACDLGTLATVTATPKGGYYFTAWRGTAVDAGRVADPCDPNTTVLMDTDYTLHACFLTTLAVLYVDNDARGDPSPYDTTLSDPCEDGTADHPFDEIREAIDVSVDAVFIVVSEGRYHENVDFGGKKIVLKGSDPNNWRVVEKTIIDGNGVGPVVIFAHSEDANCVISGFTITNGTAELGGGICCLTSSPTISRCIITRNSADNGGGICTFSGDPFVTSCIVSENSAQYGGGFFSSGGAPRLTNCTLARNNAEYGGAIVSITGHQIIANCTIVENTALQDGGGVYCDYQADLAINSTIVWGNTAGGTGSQIAISSQADPSGVEISYSDVENGQSGVHAEIGCAIDWRDGNTMDDPDFVDANTLDYHLLLSSPCVNAGDPNAECVSPTDIDGDPRVFDDRIDIGSDEILFDKAEEIDSAESVVLNPGHEADDPTSEAIVVFRNDSNEQAEIAVVEMSSSASESTKTFEALGSTLRIDTSLNDGEFEMTVLIPFTEDDLIGTNPLQLNLMYFDINSAECVLAVAGNTEPTPDPIGTRWVEDSNIAPTLEMLQTRPLGDYGVYWNPITMRGFVWANVDHCTDFTAVVYRIPDFERDGDVDVADFASFALYWLDIRCGHCGGADLNGDLDVDGVDLMLFSEYWLRRLRE